MIDRPDKVQGFVLAPKVKKRTRAIEEGFNSFGGLVFRWDRSHSDRMRVDTKSFQSTMHLLHPRLDGR